VNGASGALEIRELECRKSVLQMKYVVHNKADTIILTWIGGRVICVLPCCFGLRIQLH